MKSESTKAAARTVSQAVKTLRQACSTTPQAAVILGSGVNVLSGLCEAVNLPYEDVFGVSPSVAGHQGSITVGRISHQSPMIAVLRGRFHLYEGHAWSVVTLPVTTIIEWGVPRLYVTNAAGGLNNNFSVGDLMVLSGYRDHLNPKWKEKGLLPALLEETHQCMNATSERVLREGQRLNEDNNGFFPLQQGVYAGLLGPSYETLAEIEMLRRLKADAVGMSTVPELECAKGSKTEAAAISIITNVWLEDHPIGGHEEVLEASRAASLRLDTLFRALLS